MVTNDNIDDVIRILKRAVRQWPPAVMAHYAHDPFLTLIGCLLSLRTQDATTHAACERLFALARTPEAMLRLRPSTIERAIYPVLYYRGKTAVIRGACRALLERFGGRVPSTIDELVTIKGVGRKTANLVVTMAFGKPGICVDTHVHRITNRWGYVRTKTPDETEEALRRILPRRHWRGLNGLLVPFGQHQCLPISPLCSTCPLAGPCARIGVTHSR